MNPGPGPRGATGSTGPIDVLVVGWFPAADDPIKGRFIADQAAALLATGRVRPSVVSFEPFPLHGDQELRAGALAGWSEVVRSGMRSGLAFAPQGALCPAGVPVARLGVAAGGARGAGRTNLAIHRAAVLATVVGSSPGRWSLLHAHTGYPEGAAAAAVARARGVPLIVTEHATYLDRQFADPDIKAAYLEGARSAARIVAVSRFLADRIAREFPELAERIVVIPNTVDVEAFRPVGPAERDPDELLWVGYRREYKGIPALLAALPIIRRVRPGVRLRMIGRSPTDEEEARWHELAADLGVVEAVAFEPPSADRAGIARAIERAGLFVHASRIEMMGIVAVEALASGLPVVAVDSGGVTEVLGPRPEAVGALVARQDPELLAAAIIETLDRRDEFDPQRLRDHVVGRYGAAAVAERLADLYDEVLGASSPGARPAARAAAEASPPDPSRPVIVGFERQALDAALAAMPVRVVRDAVIVTAGLPVPGHPDAVRLPERLQPDLDQLVTLHGRARGPGLGGLVLAVPRWLRRAARRRRLIAGVLRSMTAAVADGCDRSASPTPIVVCLGGIDVVAVEPLRDAGRVIVAPGGLRWLADHQGA